MTSLNGHSGRQRRAKRANDLNADLFISIHHDGVEDRTLIPWWHNGKQHGHLDKFRGFSLWVSRQNSNYAESLAFARALGDQLLANGLEFTAHHDESTNTNKYGRVAPLVDRKRGIYAFDDFVVLKETRMPAVILEAGMIVEVRGRRSARVASPQGDCRQSGDCGGRAILPSDQAQGRRMNR